MGNSRANTRIYSYMYFSHTKQLARGLPNLLRHSSITSTRIHTSRWSFACVQRASRLDDAGKWGAHTHTHACIPRWRASSRNNGLSLSLARAHSHESRSVMHDFAPVHTYVAAERSSRRVCHWPTNILLVRRVCVCVSAYIREREKARRTRPYTTWSRGMRQRASARLELDTETLASDERFRE